ncbi:MAG: tetratricopeptide repeat protein [Rhodospirillales bacterium]|nr:tetratricopeptide repeat protein [Rhodospirillales bacterium]
MNAGASRASEVRRVRAHADSALRAWHMGSASPRDVLPILRQGAQTAADHSNLGAVLRAAGDRSAAEAAYRQAIRIDPSFAPAHHNLGNLLADGDRLEEAAAAYASAVAANPAYPDAWNALGVIRQRQGRLAEAEPAFRTAMRHAPRWVEPHGNLGVTLLGLEQHHAAERVLRHAVELDPTHAPAFGNLGALLLRSGFPIAAEEATRRALALAPAEHRWISNLAGALQMQVRHVEAEAEYRRALSVRPDYAGGHGNLLFALNYRDDLSPHAIFSEYRDWDARHARPLRPGDSTPATPTPPAGRIPPAASTPPAASAPPSPLGRRMRVGYVSADFRQHAVALFSEPLLAAHDRSRVELFCYAELVLEDETTRRFRAMADHWRPTLGLSDEQVADMIRADGIDVLVDVGGHTAGNRLLVFARKPAPLQVEYILGHGYTSGLSAMDVFFADHRLAPDGTDALFSERVLRLPRIPLAYRAPADMPNVGPLPASRNGYVTFGYFGRPERLTDRVVATWARLLRTVPGSRLVLNNRNFQEPAFCRMFLARFDAHGIGTDRIDLIYTTPQPRTWAAYAGLDIALDPFPHNAGTTTIEALYQGVPVVSLAERPTVGRFGASILHAVGLDDWVTSTQDAYVARAAQAAQNTDELARIRHGLRARFLASPLADAKDLAQQFEAAFAELLSQVTPAHPHSAPTHVRTDAARNQHAPAPVEDHHATLRALFTAGDLAGANRLAGDLLRDDPNDPMACHVAGLVAYREKRLNDADRSLAITRKYAPADVEAHANHAAILRGLGRLEEAEQAARVALALAPNRPESLNNLGNILRDLGRYPEAIAAFQAALAAVPSFADAWANLAWVYSLTGQARESERAARAAITHDPRNANGHNNLGLALMRQSRLRDAEDALRKALALQPDFVLPHSNILFCLNYRDDLTPETLFAEYRAWDRRHAVPLRPDRPDFDLDRTPGRRLRVGYVSPDFRRHAVALFAEPLLAAHDRTQVELFCYAEVPVPDETTARFRALADHWRSTVGRTDEAVADMIRADRIDVLIDLAGHTAGNRLLAFARKPAPVQIEYMLGHGYTSGLSAMDAFLADTALAPPGAEALFSERLIRLPRIPLAYLPPADMPPVSPLPARAAGHVTFGYFGRTVRLTDAVIATWARILHGVPGARLVLNSAPFSEAAGRDACATRFAAFDIGRDRLELIFTAPQPVTWAAYGRIDIALDPFPHNAGTTTIEALHQGVPVVTLAGRPTLGRFGAAILGAVGLDDWVTADTDAYVARAITAATDLDALSAVRATLRDRVTAGPLGDPAGLAHAVEAAYRTLWETWRTGRAEATRLHDLFAAEQDAALQEEAGRMLAADPGQPDALHMLAMQALRRHEPARAIDLLARARPTPDILTDRGVILRMTGRAAEAEKSYRAALALAPGHVHAQGNLGNLLLDQHRLAEAEAAFDTALTAGPDQPWLLRGRALVALARAEPAAAEPLLRRGLRHVPDDPDLHETLAALLGQNGRTIEAEQHHRAALPRIRDRHRCLGNLAVLLQTQGRHVEAEASFQEALAMRPDYAPAHSNLLFSLNYRDDLSAEAIFAAFRGWDARHAAAFGARAHAHDDLEPPHGRRLRIGYVSPDFRRHAVSLFAEPMLAAHDPAVVEVFCYAEVAVEDDVTARIRARADHWRSTVGRDDEAVADQIRADRIDVLVDLAGHTAGSRLLSSRTRPSPPPKPTRCSASA